MIKKKMLFRVSRVLNLALRHSTFINEFTSCQPLLASNTVNTLRNKHTNMAEIVNPINPTQSKTIYEFQAKDIKGNVISLDKYKDHVTLIVNVASKCGLTNSNYAQLQEIYRDLGESKGLRIVAFPCNQFAGQEPGTQNDICEFMSKRSISFDIMDKIDVNGENAHPLYAFLTNKLGGGSKIEWNFTKFIVDKTGVPVERHGPKVEPSSIVKNIEKYF